jgi:YidC/Oxa1 family membrane protein insertase
VSSLFSAPIGAAYHLVLALSAALTPITGSLAAAVAIILFTVSVRLLLSPLSFLAMRGQGRIAALAPRVKELQSRFAKQPEKLQAELTALYRQEGGGLLTGCLPLLLQIPFFSVMYRLFLSATIDGGHNRLLGHGLLGAPLGSHWLSGAGPASGQGLVYLGLFVLLAGASLVSVRITSSARPTPSAPSAGPAGGAAWVTRLLPFTTLIIAAFVPLAAGLYLLTTTAWTMVERLALRGRAGLSPRARGESGAADGPGSLRASSAR